MGEEPHEHSVHEFLLANQDPGDLPSDAVNQHVLFRYAPIQILRTHDNLPMIGCLTTILRGELVTIIYKARVRNVTGLRIPRLLSGQYSPP